MPEDRQRLEYERKNSACFLNLSVHIPRLEVIGYATHELTSKGTVNYTVVIAVA